MRKSIYLYSITFFFILLAACNPNKSTNSTVTLNTIAKDSSQIEVRYAKGFNVSYYENYKLIDIQDPQGESETIYHYALIERGTTATNIPDGYTIIETPVRTAICMTSLQLSSFIKLDATDKVIGVTSTRFLFNEKMQARLKSGQASQIGIEGSFDSEIVIALNPDIILVSPFKRGGYDAIKDLDIPLVSYLGYKETSPLGQAEWIKFTGLLLGIEEQANTQFDEIEKKYNNLKTLTQSIPNKPSVLSGEMRSGNWYVVGGKSYLAELFNDAGAEYFMKDDIRTGGFTLDFETVYAQGANADYWRLLGSHTGGFSYDILAKEDSRYKDFKSFKDKKVIYCNLREKPFYENTPMEPERVLADLIKVFHPDLLPDYTPVYYELLK